MFDDNAGIFWQLQCTGPKMWVYIEKGLINIIFVVKLFGVFGA